MNPASGLGVDPFAAFEPVPRACLVRNLARTAHQQLPVSLVLGTSAMVALAYCGLQVNPPAGVLSWTLVGLVLMLVRYWIWRRYPGWDVGDAGRTERWYLEAVLASLAYFAWLGGAAWWCMRPGSGLYDLTVVAIVFSYVTGSLQVVMGHPAYRLAMVALSGGPLLLRLLSSEQPFHLEVSAMVGLVLVAAVVAARRQTRLYLDALDLKWQGEQLAVRLREEMALARDAQAQAERSSLAKTQFFAAASHDLRQPLHALSLFAEALRERSADEGVRYLVQSINSSVEALEGLFNELMDISRIDAGALQVRRQHFMLGDLYERLRLRFTAQAFDKGLDLRWRGEHHVVWADPVIVERILQNLLSNAIRYTQDGGVLLCCRPRGTALSLEVWDTGVGIPEEEKARVFDEFYQVPRGGRVSQLDRKGLGLGLSIVTRLAALLQTRVHLDSRPGHGSRFVFSLPLGRPAEMAMALPDKEATAWAGLSLLGRVVVVVEDDLAVREALEVLLSGWGARVLTMASMQEVEDWVAGPHSHRVRPDLLILDYRLPAGRDGLEAMALLRSQAGQDIPAIVVTGSTLGGLDGHPQRASYHVLTKPVMPARLRAMISFKLGLQPGGPVSAATEGSQLEVVDQPR